MWHVWCGWGALEERRGHLTPIFLSASSQHLMQYCFRFTSKQPSLKKNCKGGSSLNRQKPLEIHSECKSKQARSFSHLVCIHDSLFLTIKLYLHILTLIFFLISLLEFCATVSAVDLGVCPRGYQLALAIVSEGSQGSGVENCQSLESYTSKPWDGPEDGNKGWSKSLPNLSVFLCKMGTYRRVIQQAHREHEAKDNYYNWYSVWQFRGLC